MTTYDVPSLTMNDGALIPQIGLGTWRMGDEVARSAVRGAIELGYRHIDTAAIYGNEVGVGQGIADAIRDGVVERSDLFVTTKIWHTENARDKARASAEASLKRLGLDYVDLLLVHWPAEKKDLYREAYDAILELRGEGKTVSAGVSNFYPEVLDKLPEAPAINQIELHPGFPQDDLVADAKERGTIVEAWTPIGRGLHLGDPAITGIAEEVGATPAQVVLAWHLRRGLVPIPKSADAGRQAENLGAVDVQLTDSHMARIAELGAGGGKRQFDDPMLMGND
ncbi:aldo/keto reductase [Corynebacterium sp. 335C]